MLDQWTRGIRAYVLLFLLTFVTAAPGVFTMPALDRDESRFAQASKQMLETGDYIKIRYQDEERNKKPAGIHWLQSATTAIFFFEGSQADLELSSSVLYWRRAGRLHLVLGRDSPDRQASCLYRCGLVRNGHPSDQ